MKWITRERPKIDRLACPWLIKKFVDKDAEFIYVAFNQVLGQAEKLQAIPFDIPDVEFTHYNDHCTFDYIIQKYKITDPAVLVMAVIVRGADTDRHDIAKESAGLLAISLGLAHNITNDYALLEAGFLIYDAFLWKLQLTHFQKLRTSPAFRTKAILQEFSNSTREKIHLFTEKTWKKVNQIQKVNNMLYMVFDHA